MNQPRWETGNINRPRVRHPSGVRVDGDADKPMGNAQVTARGNIENGWVGDRLTAHIKSY
jgi:hypothetical protein